MTAAGLLAMQRLRGFSAMPVLRQGATKLISSDFRNI
jgi:hypothetical protein